MPSTDSTAIESRITRILATRQITRDDQTFLMSIFTSGKIDESSETLINKVYEALSAGKIRVVE